MEIEYKPWAMFHSTDMGDNLEEEGFTVTVHGKGTYVAATNKNLMREEQLKEVEHDLEQAIMKGRRCGLNDEEIRNLFEMIMED